jgi:hypothetical protein
LLLAGCGSEPAEAPGHVDFIAPRVQPVEGGMDFVAGVELQPTPAMLEAMDRGVELTFLVALRASSGEIWIPGLDQRRRHRFVIDYLPLSRHYQLVDLHNDERATFPRLNMLLAELRQPRPWHIPLEADDTIGRVRARIELDRTRLPSPMRLPTWFEEQWRLDSGWRTLELGGGDAS